MEKSSLKILIVDDDKDYAEGVSLILSAERYYTEIENKAQNVFNRIDEFNPDILILDWQMPNISGLEILKYIKSKPDYRQKYIIMLSGKNTVEDIVTGIDAGADDYLTKPFDSAELIARVRAAVRILNLQKVLIENERKNTVFEMVLSITDKIGNPIAAAQILQQVIRMNINEPQKVIQSIDELGEVLSEAQALIRKYQMIKEPKSIKTAMGNHMIDPDK